MLEDANVVGSLAQMGMQAGSSTPQEARDRLAAHLKEWHARMIAVGVAPTN